MTSHETPFSLPDAAPAGGAGCFALEGAYPRDLSDLEERYGVSVDRERYFVDYRYVASNLMPDITVLPIR